MNVELLAAIIQGEGGVCGPVGMMAVALSLSCRIWQHGHDMERIEREYFGRADPEPVARLLAELVVGQELPTNEFYYCMGGRVDTQPKRWPVGDVVVRIGKESVHLYKEWPG